ncbi:MAG: dephospho-CoA kinase [Clostridiales bacterium]|nr:dephospho-CoA kinase [Clostridiales bacterium]
MRIIALTGGIACGKTTVAGWLREAGAKIIDADAISRELTAPAGEALPLLRQAFGDGVFHGDGSLDRAALGKIVFGDEAKRARLNGILHPMIRTRMEEELTVCRKTGASIVVLEIPLLFEAGMETLADIVVCVSASQEVQIKRLQSRDGLSRKDALARIRSQWPLAEKERLSHEVIRTDGPMEEVYGSVMRLYQRLVKGALNDPIATHLP